MSRMLDALRQIEARRPPEPLPPDVHRVDARTIEDVLERVEAATLLAAAEQVVVLPEPEGPIVAIATDPGPVLVEALAEPGAELFSGAAWSPVAPRLDDLAPALDRGCESRSDSPAWIDDRARALDRLAGRIAAELPATGSAVLMFGSPLSDEETTWLVAELAPALAERVGSKLLLLEANFEGPGLAGMLGAQAGRALLDVILGRCSWRDAIRPTAVGLVDVLPARGGGVAESNPKRLNLRRLLGELRAHYRLVLVDGGSLRHARAALLSRDCDGACLLLRPGETPARALRDAVAAVRRCGGRLLGTVLLDYSAATGAVSANSDH